MQINWIAYEHLLAIQKSVCGVYIKADFGSRLIKTIELPSTCVLAGAALSDSLLCVWGKPGVLREDYIQLFENLFVDTGHINEGFCNMIDQLSHKCIQHSLSLVNQHVPPTLSEYCPTMDDF